MGRQRHETKCRGQGKAPFGAQRLSGNLIAPGIGTDEALAEGPKAKGRVGFALELEEVFPRLRFLACLLQRA